MDANSKLRNSGEFTQFSGVFCRMSVQMSGCRGNSVSVLIHKSWKCLMPLLCRMLGVMLQYARSNH